MPFLTTKNNNNNKTSKKPLNQNHNINEGIDIFGNPVRMRSDYVVFLV
jgi:hypothetical protein